MFCQFSKFMKVVKSRFSYSTVIFVLLKDALLAGPRMGTAHRNSCFYRFSKKFAKVVKSKFVHSTVIFASLTDALLAAPGTRPAIWEFNVSKFSKSSSKL